MPVTTPPAGPNSASRALLACGVVAAAFFMPADLIDAATRPGYDPLRHWISHLALGELGWIGTSVLLVTAALLAACAAGLLRVRRLNGGTLAYPITVTVSTLGLLVAALFPMDPSLGFPPGAETASSFSGAVHDIGGSAFLVGSATAALLTRRHLASLGVRAPVALWSPWAGTTALLCFGTCSVLVALDYADILPGAWSGLFERAAAYIGVLWIALTARAIRMADHEPPAAGPLAPVTTRSRSRAGWDPVATRLRHSFVVR